MKLHFIRNATFIIEYAGKRILLDPFLSEKGAFPAFPNSPNQEQSNPTVALPYSVNEIIRDIDAVIVTHLHPDHFDEVASKVVPKDVQIFAQNNEDMEKIQNEGFTKVSCLSTHSSLEGITLIKTNGRHGLGDIIKMTGEVSGVILTHPNEPSLYVAGDTVWCDYVEEAIETYSPETIIVNTGAAQFYKGGPITMTKEDVIKTQRTSQALVIACHLEALNHCLLSRKELRDYAINEEIEEYIKIPNDGETLVI